MRVPPPTPLQPYRPRQNRRLFAVRTIIAILILSLSSSSLSNHSRRLSSASSGRCVRTRLRFFSTRRPEGRLSSTSECGNRIQSRPVDSRPRLRYSSTVRPLGTRRHNNIRTVGIMTCGPPLGDHHHRRTYGWPSVFVTALGTLNVSHVA